jgi:CubicO group peptidase (beta-lactamase class C family)
MQKYDLSHAPQNPRRQTAMTTTTFPGEDWDLLSPTEAGFDPDKLAAAQRWMQDSAGERPYRVAIVRGGRLVAEWNHKLDRERQVWLASATKSLFSSMLGIAVDEGKIASPDAKLVDYYPEAMDVPEGYGPKAGRYVFPKDHAITFRQLISNTSGYMKPGEEPGKVFHYQTFGMNVLTHAIAKAYDLYHIEDPEGSPGLKALIDMRLRIPIGGTWGYYLMNFDHTAEARTNIWGNYEGVSANALDMARLGWLWLNWGRWQDRQLIPEAWLREAARTAPAILANCPQEQWHYGYAFWTNDHGRLWPDLPRDSYAAAGAGSQHIWICPSLDLVVVQGPGFYEAQEGVGSGSLLQRVVEATT